MGVGMGKGYFHLFGLALQSLSGNSSGVEAVQFDVQEEVVIGGLASGSLRLWDLTQGKRA